MKLYFVFDGAADKKGEPASEGAITAPKFAFRTKAAAERYLVKVRRSEGGGGDGGGAGGGGGGGGDDDDKGGGGGGGYPCVASYNVAGSPTLAFELVAEDEESVFLGLFATKSQAQAAAKVKAGELDMDFTSSIYPVEVLDEHVE